jgi:endonuclease I
LKKVHLILLVTSILFLSFGAKAQTSRLQVSPTQLNFQPLFDGQMDSIKVILKSFNSPKYVRLSIPFAEFGSSPFFLKDTALIIETGQPRQIWVYAKPTHNVLNKAALLVQGFASYNSANPSNLNPINLSIPISCQGKFRKSYYSTTQNLSEEALKQALKTKLGQNYNSLGYNTARDNMYGTIDNFNDSVTCIYTNRKAKFNTRAGASSNNFNCEHTFPQGYFNSDEPMRSDIHHLYSTDENANNSRGNLPFGVAVPPLIQTAINFPSKNGGGKYEPQDSHKGRCARSMMYFVLRYQDYTNFYKPQDTTLRKWHRQFPVVAWDTVRNNAIFQLQSNRNPFVDYPQFENRISNLTGLSVSDSTPKLNISNRQLIFTVPNLSFDSVYNLMIWNTGNKDLKINRLKADNGPFSNNMISLLNAGDTAFSIPRNSGKVVWLYFSGGGYDTLRFRSNDPENPEMKIPVNLHFISINQGIPGGNSVKIHPNPAQKFISFAGLKSDISFEVELRDALGKSIMRTLFSPGEKAQIELPEIPSGLYQVVVSQNGFVKIEKLLINR